jgi:hypothetical protein
MDFEQLSLLDRIRRLPADRCGGAQKERLESALKPMSSFGDMEKDLPPKARYLGPGKWLEAIRDLSQEQP